MHNNFNYGLQSFLRAKSMKSVKTINLFLKEEGADFNYDSTKKANDYIERNWGKFASFCDRKIKTKELSGKAIKLNTHFDEQRERIARVRDEMDSANMTLIERNYVRFADISKVQSFLSKKGINQLKRDDGFESKKMRDLPNYRLAIENGCNLWDVTKEKFKDKDGTRSC